MLRAAEPSDAKKIYEWENNPEHWLVSNQVAPTSMRQIEQFLENDVDIFVHRQMRLMFDDFAGTQVGCVDLYEFDPKNHRVGLGILVDPAFRGKGFGNEALLLTLNYAFELLEIQCVYAEVLVSNQVSVQLFESAGFEKTGMKKRWLFDGKGYSDLFFYQKFKGA